MATNLKIPAIPLTVRNLLGYLKEAEKQFPTNNSFIVENPIQEELSEEMNKTGSERVLNIQQVLALDPRFSTNELHPEFSIWFFS